MTWIATEGYGLYPAPETLGFVPMLGTPTETRILKEGKLQPTISRVFPMSEAAEAVRHLIEDRPLGECS